jgi:glycerol-1-phosphate dehydrogenase [NAD(P)+]
MAAVATMRGGAAADAVPMLADAALASGLAMQAMGNSRPAATAEHTIAHFWEAVDAVTVPRWDLHGILVGAACRLVLPGYQAFHRRIATLRPDVAARVVALAGEPSPIDALEEGLGPLRPRIANDWRARPPAALAVAERLERFGAARDRVAALAAGLLAELGAAIAALEALGFPFSLDALGIPPALRLVPVRNVRLLRNRYTSFDLAHDLGEDDALLGPIVAQAGALTSAS